MHTNLQLKKTIKARLEGAGDIRAAIDINKASMEAYNIYCNTLVDDIGKITRNGITAIVQMLQARHAVEAATNARDLMGAMAAKSDMRNAQLALDSTWTTTPSIKLSTGGTFRIAFTKPDGQSAAAQFSLADNKVTLFIMPLLQDAGYELQDLNGKSESELGTLVNNLIKANWDPTWRNMGTVDVTAGQSVFHEMRHAHDKQNYPTTMIPHMSGIGEKRAAELNVLKSKHGDFASEATRRAGAKYLRGETVDFDVEQRNLREAIHVLESTIHQLPDEHFVRPQARQCRAFLKRLMNMFSARDAYSIVDMRAIINKLKAAGKPLDDDSLIAAASPETRYGFYVYRWIKRLYKWLGYLGSYTEINAHIAEYIPKFAMLRKTNESHLSLEQIKSELELAKIH